eukprot:1148863-Pelagomonas_calceolata.AAC.3
MKQGNFRGFPFPILLYPHMDLQRQSLRNASSRLKTESCKWLIEKMCATIVASLNTTWRQGTCPFYCKCRELCQLDAKCRGNLGMSSKLFTPFHHFALSADTDFIPYLATFQSLTNNEMSDFLYQDTIFTFKLGRNI